MPLTEPAISVIICTRNRAHSVKRCMESLSAKDFLEAPGELIVVNNSSTDETAAVLSDFARDCSFPVAIISEPKLGLSSARNAGLLRAQGEIIAFTDDDCYVTPGYLKKAIQVFQPGAFDYCGGRILLYDERDAKYTVNYRDAPRIFVPHSFILPGLIQGANMLFHKRVIQRIGLFDPMLSTGTSFRAEDIDYCARASMAGFVGAHVPELVVYHHHGRKPGKDIEDLKRENDYARGAYYTKFILLGKRQYMMGWSYQIVKHLKAGRTRVALRELRGGAAYAIARVKNVRASASVAACPESGVNPRS